MAAFQARWGKCWYRSGGVESDGTWGSGKCRIRENEGEAALWVMYDHSSTAGIGMEYACPSYLKGLKREGGINPVNLRVITGFGKDLLKAAVSIMQINCHMSEPRSLVIVSLHQMPTPAKSINGNNFPAAGYLRLSIRSCPFFQQGANNKNGFPQEFST